MSLHQSIEYKTMSSHQFWSALMTSWPDAHNELCRFQYNYFAIIETNPSDNRARNPYRMPFQYTWGIRPVLMDQRLSSFESPNFANVMKAFLNNNHSLNGKIIKTHLVSEMILHGIATWWIFEILAIKCWNHNIFINILDSLRDREVTCSPSDRQGTNFETCVR